MLALNRDVNSVRVAGTYYTVDIFQNKALLIFILLWVTSPRLLCPLGNLNNR